MPRTRPLVSAIIHMASSLGLQTIAEGVETEDQRRFLQAQGCDEIQGYPAVARCPPRECERFARQLRLPPPQPRPWGEWLNGGVRVRDQTQAATGAGTFAACR